MQFFHKGPAGSANVQFQYFRDADNAPFALVGIIEDGEFVHVAVTGWNRKQQQSRSTARNVVAGRAKKRMAVTRQFQVKSLTEASAWDVQQNGDRHHCKSTTLTGMEAYDAFVASVENAISEDIGKKGKGALHIRRIVSLLKT